MSEATFMGVPRSKIDWSPRIDFDKCNGCMECVEFCPHDVFEVRSDQTPSLIVKNPENCVVFCRACAITCGPDAMDFPAKNETTAHIKNIRGSSPSARAGQDAKTTDYFPPQLNYEIYQKDKFLFRLPTGEGFYFNENDVWAYVSGSRARIGITDYVQKSLSDIVYFEPPALGAAIAQFGDLGSIESAKAVFEIISPVSGVVTAYNEKLVDVPELLNQNPYEQGWIAEVELADFAGDSELLHNFGGYLPIMKRKVDEYRV
jgi:glycine cleavage system H lipoate-binding protein/NAD-dependent dihydropyrimidine dehydrogenase PreA subunit